MKQPHYNSIIELEKEIYSCRTCIQHPYYLPPLPHEPKPVVYLSDTASIAIAGQAPGLRVHETSIPFNDRSGERLRNWLNVTKEEFYNRSHFAIVPMGFCFPGYDQNKYDLPPRRECHEIWHEKIFHAMPQIKLVLAIGSYAQKWHITELRHKTVSATVSDWRNILSIRQPRGYHVMPLPHPSWRNTSWLQKNSWFNEELIVYLQSLIREFL
ncbi:uracil-DNA glycosylase family protein [Bartonella vinsonii]|uniref:Putative uracil-DNA glycosylase protein n=1 Tax=Bartonella vinsonii subsp. berkhoffii str. Tweed TaxID=1094502 RepID=N6UXD2_BARVB|nr:uracil-DNA glycosylase family protein [Bartonella vinsonii]ENN94728.1 putative uracil-DNA glycosylase protein [Bartonella vinsonii subsp. berkhoffii str. Tweed]